MWFTRQLRTWFGRPRVGKRPVVQHRARLSVEQLETRDLASTTPMAVTLPDHGRTMSVMNTHSSIIHHQSSSEGQHQGFAARDGNKVPVSISSDGNSSALNMQWYSYKVLSGPNKGQVVYNPVFQHPASDIVPLPITPPNGVIYAGGNPNGLRWIPSGHTHHHSGLGDYTLRIPSGHTHHHCGLVFQPGDPSDPIISLPITLANVVFYPGGNPDGLTRADAFSVMSGK